MAEDDEECDGVDLRYMDCEAISSIYTGGTLGCSDACLFDTSSCISNCGNHFLDEGEECDDGSGLEWDGCRECRVVEFRVNETTGGFQQHPDVAILDDGRFIAVWQSPEQDGDKDGIVTRVFSATGEAETGEILVNDFYSGIQGFPSIDAGDDGKAVIAWQSQYQDGDEAGIVVRHMSDSGELIVDEAVANDHTAQAQVSPRVASNIDGSYIVVWASFMQDGDGYAIVAKQFDAFGGEASPEVIINETEVGYQWYPCIDMTDDGRVLIAWEGQEIDTDNWDIFARGYHSDMTPLTPEFRVNATNSGDQRQCHVSVSRSDDAIITWLSGSDGDIGTIMGQRLSVVGEFDGPEVTFEGIAIGLPRSVWIASDEIAITWLGIDESDWGISYRFFGVDGTSASIAFEANVFSSGVQTAQSISAHSSGNSVVIWQSAEQDGDGFDIFAQRIGSDGSPLGRQAWP